MQTSARPPALEIEPEIGLLLPSRVVVRVDGERCVIDALDAKVIAEEWGGGDTRTSHSGSVHPKPTLARCEERALSVC